jgi:hypothetical protein
MMSFLTNITGFFMNFELLPIFKVWLQLVQWFLRRRLKCEMLTDGRKVMTIAMMSFLTYITGFFINFELLPILTDYEI